MSSHQRLPCSMVSIDDALFVALEDQPESEFLSSADEDWLHNARASNRFLLLNGECGPLELLDRFQHFLSGTECRSVIISSGSINTNTNLLSFHALETGFRVFLVIGEFEEQIIPDILRLTYAGVSVLSRAVFENEVLICSALCVDEEQ